MMPLSEKVGLSAMDLLSGKKLQGAIMGGNRFPVDIPRLVDFYLRGLLDLDSIVAETIPLEKINEGFDKMKKGDSARSVRSEEHTSELQSLMRISYAVFCLKKKKNQQNT